MSKSLQKFTNAPTVAFFRHVTRKVNLFIPAYYLIIRELPGVARVKKLMGKKGNCLPTLKFQKSSMYDTLEGKGELFQKEDKIANF